MSNTWIRACQGRRGLWVLAVVIFVGSFLVLGSSLRREVLFVDEAAFISQSYFWDLVTSARFHDPRWLEYPAYDLPPLPKYTIGAALQIAGIARVDRPWALAWYSNLHERRFLSDRMLHVARWPSVGFGALGCVAIFLIGQLAFGLRAGVLAAIFLSLNPLYRLHAMRAMADVPAEGLLLWTCALGLIGWKLVLRGEAGPGRSIVAGGFVGVLGGLAVLAKLNGGLGLMIVGAWSLLGLWVARASRTRLRNLILMTTATGVVSLATFVTLNPFVWAHPARIDAFPLANPVPADETIVSRLTTIVKHRFEVPRSQQVLFPHNALISPFDKASALIVQGFGRFGPFGPLHSDSTRRYDRSQDLGAIFWLPWVLAGVPFLILRGRRQLQTDAPPTAWCVVVLFAVSILTVGWFLPLAWDRYYLSIQAGSALLASVAAIGITDRLITLGRSR